MMTSKPGAGEQVIRVQTPIRIQSPDGQEIQQIVEAPVKPPTIPNEEV